MLASKMRRWLFEPLYCKVNKSPRLSYFAELNKTQFLTTWELEEIQWNRLQRLYAFLWKNNSYYRDRFLTAGLSADSLRQPADIKKLPLLTKQDIRNAGMSMFSDGFERKGLLHFKTGGSTGKALDIYITEECSELRNACARRHDCWTGWKPGEPVGAVWGNPNLPSTIKENILHTFIQPYIYLDTMAISSQAVKEFAHGWSRVKPTLLYGHAHSLFLLAQYVSEIGCDEIKPKGILSTSMMLLPHERKVIENVFSCMVTDRYGCEEVSLISCSCEKNEGLHMNIEHLVIEFIKDDGTEAEVGEPGNVIVTDLMNFAMPFIRYKVEDIAGPIGAKCSCGRGLPLMGSVTGRVADFLIKHNGAKVAGVSLIENTLTKLPGIDQMQIVQDSLDDIMVNIVPGSRYSEPIADELILYFEGIFEGARVCINEVDVILPEKSGKYRFSICNVPGVNCNDS